jgi:hypothetical protein
MAPLTVLAKSRPVANPSANCGAALRRDELRWPVVAMRSLATFNAALVRSLLVNLSSFAKTRVAPRASFLRVDFPYVLVG